MIMGRLFFLICFALSALTAISQKTFIWCGSLIDGISNEPKKNMTLVVEKNKIIVIENGFSKASTADKTIDLKTKTVTPGWMDMHVHMEGETNPNAYLERFTLNPPDIAFNSVSIAERPLMAGFTTVRDLGGSEQE